jgi:hypothetical protein
MLVLEMSSREAPTLVKPTDSHVPQQHDPSGRRLRDRLLVANAIAWIVIIVLIRLIFL